MRRANTHTNVERVRNDPHKYVITLPEVRRFMFRFHLSPSVLPIHEFVRFPLPLSPATYIARSTWFRVQMVLIRFTHSFTPSTGRTRRTGERDRERETERERQREKQLADSRFFSFILFLKFFRFPFVRSSRTHSLTRSFTLLTYPARQAERPGDSVAQQAQPGQAERPDRPRQPEQHLPRTVRPQDKDRRGDG